VAVTALLALVLAACSSSGATKTTASPSSSVKPATGTPVKPATGTPIAVGALCNESPPVVASECYTVQDAVYKQFNDAGGLNGRPIQLQHCDASTGNPENAPNCLRKFVGDPSILALTGSISTTGFTALVGSAKMANIGPNVRVPEELTSPLSFPIASLSESYVANIIQSLASQKKSPVAIYPNISAGLLTLSTIKDAYSARGITLVAIPASLSEPTYAPFVSKAKASNGDPLYLLLSQTQLARAITDANGLGYHPQFVASYACYDTNNVIKPLGSQLEGTACSTPWNINMAGSEVTNVMQAAGATGYNLSFNSIIVYEAAKMFIAALKTINGPITRDSVYTAMSQLKFSDPALLAPLDFSALPGPSKTFPRISNGLYNVYEFKGGQLNLLQSKVDIYSRS
jgi:branched-chain amino acid transport system substrate-binding protein